MRTIRCAVAALWLLPALAVAQSPSGAVPPVNTDSRFTGAAEVVEGMRNRTDEALNVHRTIRDYDNLSNEIMDRADARMGVVQHTMGAIGAYREEGAEGMLVYGWEGLLDEGTSNLGKGAASAYYTLRTGQAITSTATGAAGIAFTVGTALGDWIKTQKHWTIDGRNLESHVTDLYFNNLHGRDAQRQFDRITSDESIERHRQMLRQQRFQAMSSANEQAAAERRWAAAQDASAASDAAAAHDFTMMMLPVLGAAAASRAYQPIIPPSAPQFPVVAPNAPGTASGLSNGRSLANTPPLGSTFGSPPPDAQRICYKRRECYKANPSRGYNIECDACLDPKP